MNIVKEIKSMNNRKKFEKICRKNKKELKSSLFAWLRQYYDDAIDGDGYLYAKGTDPVLLTAHMDTVHHEQIKTVTWKIQNDKHVVSSPQGIGGDDRCGIYMIKNIIQTTELRPSILFCEDEEIGGVGSEKFCKTKYVDDLKEMLFLIELDRAHDKDLVFYSDTNYDFQDFCEEATGYKTAYGTFSDISNLSPACGVSSVNISCGYYNAHQLIEYVVFEEMENSIQTTIELIKKGLERGEAFKYEERQYYNGYNGIGTHSKYYYDDGYNESYYDWYHSNFDKKSETQKEFDNEDYDVYYFMLADGSEIDQLGRSMNEAFGSLCFEYPSICWNDIIDYYKADSGYVGKRYGSYIDEDSERALFAEQ